MFENIIKIIKCHTEVIKTANGCVMLWLAQLGPVWIMNLLASLFKVVPTFQMNMCGNCVCASVRIDATACSWKSSEDLRREWNIFDVAPVNFDLSILGNGLSATRLISCEEMRRWAVREQVGEVDMNVDGFVHYHYRFSCWRLTKNCRHVHPIRTHAGTHARSLTYTHTHTHTRTCTCIELKHTCHRLDNSWQLHVKQQTVVLPCLYSCVSLIFIFLYVYMYVCINMYI